MTRIYDPLLVTVSVLIAIVASYTALDLAGRVAAARGRQRLAWLLGGCIAMGIGIWSMHFVGMLAFSLRMPAGRVPIAYDMPLMLVSVLVAIVASALALAVVGRARPGTGPLLAAGVFMGAAIAGMQYIGFASMRLPARISYSGPLVAASIAIALGASLVALWLAFVSRDESTPQWYWRRIGSALVLGIAIAGMHYTAMTAARFTATGTAVPILSDRVLASSALAATVTVATIVVLGLALFSAMIDRQFKAQLAEARALQRSEERLRGAYDALGFGVVAQNAAGEVTHVNEAARELLGLTLEQLQGRAPLATNWRLVTEDGSVADPAAHPLAVARNTGAPARNVVLGVVNGAGSVRWILVNAIPVIDPATGRLDEAIASFVDITERKQAQEERQAKSDELERANDELRRANEQLLATAGEAESARLAAEAANRAKSEFLATMSHELRTPLNAILGYTELMELNLAGPVSEQQRSYLERVRSSGKHLLGLINEVLDIAKVEAGQLTLEREQARFDRVAEAAVALIRPQAAARGLKLAVHCDTGADAGYVGDEVRVRQILVNLLSNAVKFTAPGGQVTVRCAAAERVAGSLRLTSRGPWVSVRVEDTGIGIPAEKLEAIFEPFVQVDSGPTRAHGGTGLGLAISRRLARLMGGDITVASTLGRGAAFTLWLPTPAAVPGAVGGPADAAAADARPRPALLGVDAIGDLLSAGTIDDILATFVDRLRADPATPRARELSDEVLEDHIAAFLFDVAQALVIVREQGHADDLLRDGTEIQRVMSERHGAQRFRYGWTEDAMRREFAVLRQEIEVAVRRNAPAGADAAVASALARVRRMLDASEEMSLRGFRGASEASRSDGNPPEAGGTDLVAATSDR